MGRMKKLYEELTQVKNYPPNQPFPVPLVHILLCDEVPVGVYVDKNTAEYEMHLCKQADAHMGEHWVYAIRTMPLITHRRD